MKVFKFGGASVKDADSIANLGKIIDEYPEDQLIVVISAMGKTTNALEKVLQLSYYDKLDFGPLLEEVKEFHFDVIDALQLDSTQALKDEIEGVFNTLSNAMIQLKRSNTTYDYFYDQVVSTGELLSTLIVSHYLNKRGLLNKWLDCRQLIKTDQHYRSANVNWKTTREAISTGVAQCPERLLVVQGFIGSDENGHTTTLGREGSDFSAAIFGNVLDAEQVIIWKDVPGILNADPKYFNGVKKLTNLSYLEAVELAYYGATIIHPKTIKPLQNKKIPLYVKSFLDYKNEGSVVNENATMDDLIPSYIFRTDQVLISISARDYAFIVEETFSRIFSLFSQHGVTINLMQNSAISFSVCVNNEKEKVSELIADLKTDYKVLYNEGLELLTVRHYNQKTLDQLTENKELLVVQKSRHTARFVMR
jgi:aspartate kinase